MKATTVRVLLATMALSVALVSSVVAQRGQGAAPAPAPAPTPQASAPIDVTGYWVSIVSEDWRWRMVTPPKGDVASIPVTPAGRKAAANWNPEADAASGNACKAFGVGGLMRQPGRLHPARLDDAQNQQILRRARFGE